MKVELSSIPEEQQEFLKTVQAKMQALMDARIELLQFIDDKVGWEDGKIRLDGEINYHELGIEQWFSDATPKDRRNR